MAKKKIQHDYVCQVCGKPATNSVQDVWKSFDILPNGDFVETNEWEGSTNDFFCDEHSEDDI